MVSFSRPFPTKTFPLDQLNDHFTSVSNKHVNAGDNDLFFILGNELYFSRPVFSFSVHLDQVLHVLGRVKSKAKGVDGLSAQHLSLAAPGISKFLIHLFNRSLSSGEFPELWKKTLVFPLSKSIELMSISETRPIPHVLSLSS